IVGALLLLRRQTERSPPPTRLPSRVEVGVVGNLDLDLQREAALGATSGAGALAHGGEHRLVQLRILAAGGDEAVPDPAGELAGEWTARGDVDGWRCLRALVDGGLAGLVVLAVVVDPFLRPQRANEVHRLTQPGPALLATR